MNDQRQPLSYPTPRVPEPSEVNPYAPPATLGRPVAFSQPQVPARRLSRLAAHFLDFFLAFAAALPGFMLMASETMVEVGAVVLSLGLIAIVVYNFVLLHRQGQTLGKKILRVRILRSDGGRASLRRIIVLRAFLPGVIGAIPGLGALFGLLDALWIFGAESRCIHDYLADTIVVEA